MIYIFYFFILFSYFQSIIIHYSYFFAKDWIFVAKLFFYSFVMWPNLFFTPYYHYCNLYIFENIFLYQLWINYYVDFFSSLSSISSYASNCYFIVCYLFYYLSASTYFLFSIMLISSFIFFYSGSISVSAYILDIFSNFWIGIVINNRNTC